MTAVRNEKPEIEPFSVLLIDKDGLCLVRAKARRHEGDKAPNLITYEGDTFAYSDFRGGVLNYRQTANPVELDLEITFRFGERGRD